MTLTLTGDIAASARLITVTGAVPADVVPGYSFRLDDEMLTFQTFDAGPLGALNAVNVQRWHVRRGENGTVRATHSAGATVYAAVDANVASTSTTPPNSFDAGGGGGGLTVTDGTTSVAATSIQQPAGLVTEGSAGIATLVPCIVSDVEPADPGPGFFWLRKIADGNSFQLYVRSDASGWHQASAGVGSGDYGDGFSEAAARQVGVYDLDNGTFIGLEAVPIGSQKVQLTSNSVNGNDTTRIQLNGGQLTFRAVTMSFFGASAVAQPTGVAVSAAGIHAALVALGLITA